MAIKQQFHDLIERLPEKEIATVYGLLAGLLADPLWIASARLFGIEMFTWSSPAYAATGPA